MQKLESTKLNDFKESKSQEIKKPNYSNEIFSKVP